MKQYQQYRMNFDSKAMGLSGICMGVSIFTLAVYYLFALDYSLVPLGTKLFYFWLPVMLSLAYIVLYRLVRLNAPGVYAIIGAVFCLLLIIGLFKTTSLFRIILGILSYLICGAALILGTGGYLPGRLTATVCFAIVLTIRLLCFTLGKVKGIAWLPELADLSVITALMCLSVAMIPVNKKELS